MLSVIGDSAKALLTRLQLRTEDIAFFMIGHAAPKDRRKEMVIGSAYVTQKLKF